MKETLKQAALDYHRNPRPGKIEVVPTKQYMTPEELSLAYSPGVAYPCLEIKADAARSYDYTNRGNLVAVISNGTATLGLGNTGAEACKPVMEGKALLFKIFAGLDAFDIEVNETDPQRFVQVVKSLEATFGGINLEDIKAPECFEIEESLVEQCNIPVMHDDQHGTAIISAAGLLNALEIQGKDITTARLVVNGAGAAAMACTNLYRALGIRRENIVMCDSRGVISTSRTDLNPYKQRMATSRTDIHTLTEALVGADIFLGLSVAGVLTADMIRTMAPRPIVFALANPEPEITYGEAMSSRNDLIFATGRSDYPNQINNVLGFPYIFRAALDCRATAINEPMKKAAAIAIAALAHEPVPSDIASAYGEPDLHFGSRYILPKPFDRRLLTKVAPAIIRAAEQSGVARRHIVDFNAYTRSLESIIHTNDALIQYLIKQQTSYNSFKY
ncbi:MAG: malic enzyme-like NAD(P)-binding protein [Muribaculaceae bacterium]